MPSCFATLRSGGRHFINAFRGLSKQAWGISVVFFINRAGTMVVPFLSLYLTQEKGFQPAQAGLVLAMFGAGSIVGVLAGGRLTSRYGAHPVMAASLLSGGACFLVLGSLESPAALIGFVALTAACAESFRPAAMTALAQSATKETTTRTMALGRFTVNLGMAVGPAVGGWLAERNYHALFWVDAGTCWLAAVFLALFLKPPPRDKLASQPRRRFSLAWQDRPLLAMVVMNFLLSLIFFQAMATLPLYVHDVYGMPESSIGALFAINCAIIVVLEMGLVAALERFDAVRVFGVGCLLTGVGFGLTGFGSTAAFAVLTVVIWTFGEMTTSPFASAAIATRAPEGMQGDYMGLFMSAFSVGHLAAPALGLWMYEHISPHSVWYFCLGLGPVLWLGSFRLAPHFRRSLEIANR